MYRTEEFKNRIDMEDYLKNYMDGAGFLDYCERRMGYDQIWSCPLYDFNPAEYGGRYKYFYLIGKKVIFESAGDREKEKPKGRVKDRAKEKEEKKEQERYMSQVCLREKDRLSEKIQALEEKYPGSIALSAGSCHVCSRCKRPETGGCRYSDDIRYFIESLGCSAGGTAGELLGIELQWRKQKLPESLTLVNGLLTDDPKVEL